MRTEVLLRSEVRNPSLFLCAPTVFNWGLGCMDLSSDVLAQGHADAFSEPCAGEGECHAQISSEAYEPGCGLPVCL